MGGPILHNGMIFAISGDGGDRDMVALAPTDGDVTGSALAWEKKRGRPTSRMTGHGDYVFWIADKENKGVAQREDRRDHGRSG